MDKRKWIIDTDGGSDDAMAIAMGLRDERHEILMFVSVAGNVRVHQAARNTLAAIEVAGTYAPPVYVGASQPLLREFKGAADTHGEDGLGDVGFVPSRLHIAKGNGILKMLEALAMNPGGTLEILCLGPLTNIALAIRTAPDLMRKVKRLFIMGTAGLGTGNVTPVAEFNIWQDPEAAKIVFEFGLPLFVVGWDACLEDAMLNSLDLRRLREAGSIGRFCVDSNKTLIDLNAQRFGEPTLDMADPAALAAAFEPDCIEDADPYYCEIDATPGPSYGGCLVDFYHFSGKEPNAILCSRLKARRFKDYVFRTLTGREYSSIG